MEIGNMLLPFCPNCLIWLKILQDNKHEAEIWSFYQEASST